MRPFLNGVIISCWFQYDTYEFHTQGGSMNYVLKDLKPFTAYCFYVVAENALGMSERPTSRVSFQTKCKSCKSKKISFIFIFL